MTPAVPIHPMLVHFPIALLIAGALFEVVGLVTRAEWWRRAAAALLILAALGAGAAFFSGRAAEEAAERGGVPETPIEDHERAAQATLIAIGAAVILVLSERLLGKRAARALPVLAAAAYVAAAALVGLTGHRGGRLVYEHGAGVKAAIHAAAEDRHRGERGEDRD